MQKKHICHSNKIVWPVKSYSERTRNRDTNRKCAIPAAQSQYLEWVYFGGNKSVVNGITTHGINWNIMRNRRSLNVLQAARLRHSPTSNHSNKRFSHLMAVLKSRNQSLTFHKLCWERKRKGAETKSIIQSFSPLSPPKNWKIERNMLSSSAVDNEQQTMSKGLN